jgi:acyl-CoA thioesterase-1
VKRLFVLLLLVVASVSANGTAPAEAPVILVFGDSISAGYGLARVEQGWVALLQTRLKTQEYGYQVVNASVSGETYRGRPGATAASADPASAQNRDFGVGRQRRIARLAVAQMRANLLQMVDLSLAAGARVLLLGMRMPPNYGPEFTEQFRSSYSELARDKNLPLVPFLLNDIALRRLSCRPMEFTPMSSASRSCWTMSGRH